MHDNHPIPAFHFRVIVNGLDESKIPEEKEQQFQSISGLKITAHFPDMLSGNTDSKRVIDYHPLILRRAISRNIHSPFRQWILENVQKPSSDVLDEMLIEVLNDLHDPQITFQVKNITVSGWELGELHAEKSGLLMEEITLQYTSITIL